MIKYSVPYSSLAEASMENGDNQMAINIYQITLEKLLQEEDKDQEWIDWVNDQLTKIKSL